MKAIPIGGKRLLGGKDPMLVQPLNDHGNALRINALRASELLYSHDENSWYVWDNFRWAKDRNGAVMRVAKTVMLEFLTSAIAISDGAMETFAKRSLDHPRLVHALASLRCEVPVDVTCFDRDRHLLNLKNGTLDLRTKELRPHNKNDRITRLVDYDYVPGTPCPRFLSFLERVMGGGPDAGEADIARAAKMVGYLQRAIGYSLTGETSEKVVFIAHGSGNNGKSTLLDVIRQIAPEYSSKILIDSLMAKPGGESTNTLTDLADLRGARFVNTSETEAGQRLSEGRLKRITQGMGTIKAVRKYENPITFPETHKLWIDANHLPVIGGSENAIWNRLHTIPFSVVIPPEEIDRQLPLALLSEAEGILAWAIEGASLWYSHGLGKPSAVSDAVAIWREDMDLLGPFLEEMCEVVAGDEKAWIKASDLWKAYIDHTERNEEKRVLNKDGFHSQLESRGLTRGKKENGTIRVWKGIRFRRSGTRDDPGT